jgi:hypothetical protein
MRVLSRGFAIETLVRSQNQFCTFKDIAKKNGIKVISKSKNKCFFGVRENIMANTE